MDTNITNDIGIKLTLFADNNSIFITGKDTQDLIFDLDRINGSILPWFDRNRLIIKKGKSLALGFNHKSNKHMVFPDIILKDRHTIYVSEIIFLGVWLDQNIKWDCHVENLIVKLSKLCFAMEKIKSFISKNVVKPCSLHIFIHLWNMIFYFWETLEI